MDKKLFDKYMAEMLAMRSSPKTVPTVSQEETAENNQTTEPIRTTETDDSSGKLIAIVTAIRRLYPIKNAKVTVFTGDYKDMQVIATDFTDESGRTKTFTLDTPAKELSMEASENKTPYALYNMLIEAEGYIDNIHLNIPVFSGVTSLQSSDMLLVETSGVEKGPQIFDEAQKYNL